ncbi:MAG: Spx/MgsR family RNA polymerase-binding regulatory protein [Wenzhouxiangella sp.]|jgi:Spx/MgsR family transcriptional regulator|nr:Spx/MgsR family RNA polymerase-binding regulatory protein [Wenzhouxiangella sp.]
MSRLTIYGIKSCDTCRKAIKWLDEHEHSYRWHDLRADGIEGHQVRRWLTALGTDLLINRRSTTWRSLSEAERARAGDPDQAVALLVSNPTLIKRPVFERDDRVMVGFDAAVRESL